MAKLTNQHRDGATFRLTLPTTFFPKIQFFTFFFSNNLGRQFFQFKMDNCQTSTYESFEQQLMKKSVDYMAPQAPLSLIVQQSLTYDSIDGQNFPYKLWFLINNPAFGDVLHWSRDGTAIVFPDDKLFVQKVLKRKEGKIFKTESLKSFVRQLNLYGFRKVMCDRYDTVTRSKFGSMFDHECFMQGRPDLLEFVKRRCNVKMSQKEEDSTPNLTLESFLQNRTRRSCISGLEYEDRATKRRLRFSPQGKENGVPSPSNMLQRMQNPPALLTDNFINNQTNFLPYLQNGLLYQNPNEPVEHHDVSTFADLDSGASAGQTESLSKDESVALPAAQPIVVTLPKSMILPTSSHVSLAEADTKNDLIKMSLQENLNSIFSPTTPSEISLVQASYLTTPTTLLNNTSNFASPGLYAATGPSPLSALCASLFSPFCDPQNSIHKATQTSGGPKALSILADQATKMDTWCQTQDSASKRQ